MENYIVTGATGQLGSLVVEYMLKLGVPAESISALVRNEAKAAKLKASGIKILNGDYDQIETLRNAFKSADKLLLISSSAEDDLHRMSQHIAAVEAARDAGVKHIYYTGLAFADKVKLGMEKLHLATELAIKESGITYTILRNAMYFDIFLAPRVQGALSTGIIPTASKNGKMNFISRKNLAMATATVLLTNGHDNKVYELSSPEAYSFNDVAAILKEISGKNIENCDMTPPQAREEMIKQGLPEWMADYYMFIWPSFEAGYYAYTSNHIKELIGNKYITLQEELQEILSNA